MELAAARSGQDLYLYIEGLSLKRLSSLLSDEKVRIHLLVFTEGLNSTYHDGSYTSPTLAFCRQQISIGDIQQSIRRAGFNQPTEMIFSNDRFYLQQYFTGAYRVTFFKYGSNKLCGAFIDKLIPRKRGLDFLAAIHKQKRAATARFIKEYAGLTLDRFAEQRFDKYHARTVKAFNRALMNGTARCDGCESRGST